MIMETFAAAEYQHAIEELSGWAVGVTVYRLQDTWHCKIDNVHPGATVARAQAPTREAALAEAHRKAGLALARTMRTAPDGA